MTDDLIGRTKEWVWANENARKMQAATFHPFKEEWYVLWGAENEPTKLLTMENGVVVRVDLCPQEEFMIKDLALQKELEASRLYHEPVVLAPEEVEILKRILDHDPPMSSHIRRWIPAGDQPGTR